MSTAFFPTNMRRQSASGYSNHSSLENIPYVSWKGTGIYKNPIGVTATHIRPLTNKDPGNIFPTGFGLPRPLKQYRKGTVIPVHHNYDTIEEENLLINYNTNRAVKSSTGSSLGGGNGGTGLISQMIDMPGSTIIKEPNIETIDGACDTCTGVGMVSSWMPIRDLTEKPQSIVTNPVLCCNQQKKAIRRVLPTNTNVKKDYFQTTYMYLYNRCQTFQQREFNFITGPIDKKVQQLFMTYPFITAKILEYSKPGDPLSIVNQYVAQCNPNIMIDHTVESGFLYALLNMLVDSEFISSNDTEKIDTTNVNTFINSCRTVLTEEQYKVVIDYIFYLAMNNPALTNNRACAKVYYKPNNPQFAQQGGVSSSTRILKLNVDTISSAASKNKNTYILKDKVPACQPQTYIGNPFFFQGQHQNKNICNGNGISRRIYNSVHQKSAGNYIGSTLP